jgi:hypothetical protein
VEIEESAFRPLTGCLSTDKVPFYGSIGTQKWFRESEIEVLRVF